MFAVIDCNNFFVSCEKVFNPALEGRAVVVLSNNDGCVVSRSQEAKDMGVKMGMPAFQMEEQFGNRVQPFSSNYKLYGDMSRRVMAILQELVPSMEIYSIDECFASFKGMDIRQIEDILGPCFYWAIGLFLINL